MGAGQLILSTDWLALSAECLALRLKEKNLSAK